MLYFKDKRENLFTLLFSEFLNSEKSKVNRNEQKNMKSKVNRNLFRNESGRINGVRSNSSASGKKRQKRSRT